MAHGRATPAETVPTRGAPRDPRRRTSRVGARPGGISVGAKNPAVKNGGTTRPTATSLPRFAETASAAGLADPSLARSARGDDGNALWILWLVLLALVAAASTLLWWWQRRAPGDPESTPDVTPPAPA